MPRRLRWQLTLSHLVATAFTLVAMVAAIIFISTGWATFQNGPQREPVNDARTVANILEDLVVRGAPATELNTVLGSLARGRVHVGFGPPPFMAGPAGRLDRPGPVLRNVAYLAVVGTDGRVLGSSDQAGVALDPPGRARWSPLLEHALAGERGSQRLVSIQPDDEPPALGAYPMFGDGGRVVGAVVVAKTAIPSPDWLGSFWRGLAIFSAATVAVLGAAFLFALASSSLLAYLLARRLVARLERLGRAAEALAANEPTSRIEEGPPDEVGQLTRRFNDMADRLSATVGELEAEKGHAESLLQTKRDLVANVSHELRTPLASIRAHVESLLMQRRNGRDDRRDDYLAVIHRETEHLSRLIDDLFVLSTAEAGALRPRLEPVTLAEVVDEVADSLGPVARRERRVTVITRTGDVPPVLADRERVFQILSNLVRNAIRHTPEGGLVSIRVERDDGRAAVTVEDTGVGIAPERLAHVFERFYRGDDARDRASGGAGLGLAIVRELVEAMGGDVSADSVVGEGSRFTFTLPLARDAMPAEPRTAAASRAV